MPSPLKVLARFVAHEKGLFAGAILVAGIAAALGVPFDFVLFGLTTISFARHPEGLVESGKRKAHERMERLAARRREPTLGLRVALSRL